MTGSDLVIVPYATVAPVFAAGNDACRWAQIESLVDLGTPTGSSAPASATRTTG